MSMGQDLPAIEMMLDEVQEILAGLPIRPGQKRVITQMICDLYSEIEGAVELSSADYD
jgi:hypothetical protein